MIVTRLSAIKTTAISLALAILAWPLAQPPAAAAAPVKLEVLPEDLEIELALSSLPPHLRKDATVYVLRPTKGCERVRQGSNGFHALVSRLGDDTFNFPHVMHYAPNLTRADIGGAQPGSPYPFLLFPGPHGYSIQMVGIAEREAINKEHAELIDRLCKLRHAWCLPEQSASATTANHEH